MIDYEVESVLAQLAMIIGLAVGGFITFQTQSWIWGIFVTLLFGFMAWAVLRLARTEPIDTAEPVGVLDVLEPQRHF